VLKLPGLKVIGRLALIMEFRLVGNLGLVTVDYSSLGQAQLICLYVKPKNLPIRFIKPSRSYIRKVRD
jgi:hypothetical protein